MSSISRPSFAAIARTPAPSSRLPDGIGPAAAATRAGGASKAAALGSGWEGGGARGPSPPAAEEVPVCHGSTIAIDSPPSRAGVSSPAMGFAPPLACGLGSGSAGCWGGGGAPRRRKRAELRTETVPRRGIASPSTSRTTTTGIRTAAASLHKTSSTVSSKSRKGSEEGARTR